jgi:hypothetical protein
VRRIWPSGGFRARPYVSGWSWSSAAPLTTLRRRLPGVLGVPELPLRQLVEPLLLAAKHIELVLALLRLHFRGIERRHSTRVGGGIATQQSSKEAH